MVGGAYKLLWSSNIGNALHDKILPKHQIKNEIIWSVVSSFLFAFSGVLIGILWQLGVSKIYLKFDTYSLWYLPLSFIVFTLFHEVYFYFTHIWMHRPNVYRRIHRVHHLSVKTSPFASFSFHPLEAIVHAVFIPFMVLIVPIHPAVIIAYLTFMTITAISNHAGVELVPFKFIRNHFISGNHHSIHHQKMRYNYGLYYTFMDRLMGTDDSSLEKKSIVTNLEKSYE
jgi:sterol desaturase/sphingolipid hydroxylase (fatty acid hydroxylase superfamily)